MKTQTPGPTKYTRGGKTVTSALAFTAMIGIWSGIGHLEAKDEQVQAAQPVAELPPAFTVRQPPVAPLATLAPIPTLALSFSTDGLTTPLSEETVELIIPVMPALSQIPTMAPLPSLPERPAPPPSSSSSTSSSGGNSSSSSSKSGGS